MASLRDWLWRMSAGICWPTMRLAMRGCCCDGDDVWSVMASWVGLDG